MGGGVSRLPFTDRRNPHPWHGAPCVPTAPPGVRAPPSPHGSRGLEVSVIAHHSQGNCPLSPSRTQGPWPSPYKARASLDKCASPSTSPGCKCCIVISEQTWASLAGSAGPTPVSTADSSPSSWVDGEGPGRQKAHQTNRGPSPRPHLPAKGGGGGGKLEGSPSRPPAGTHTLAGGCGRGSGRRVRSPLASLPPDLRLPLHLFLSWLDSVREDDVAPWGGVLVPSHPLGLHPVGPAVGPPRPGCGSPHPGVARAPAQADPACCQPSCPGGSPSLLPNSAPLTASIIFCQF